MFSRFDLFVFAKIQKMSHWITHRTSLDHWNQAIGCLNINSALLIFLFFYFPAAQKSNPILNILFAITLIVTVGFRHWFSLVQLRKAKRYSQHQSVFLREWLERKHVTFSLGFLTTVSVAAFLKPMLIWTGAEIFFWVHFYLKAVLPPPPKTKASWVLSKSPV